MTGRESLFGVFFYTDDPIDVEEVKEHFGKYGEIAYVTQVQKKVFVNFVTKEGAENCLSDSPDLKYGKVKRGKFGSGEAQNSKEMNNENDYKRNGTFNYSKKADKYEKKKNSFRKSESESDESSAKSRFSLDDDPCRKIPNSQLVSRPRRLERESVLYESKNSSSDGPPALLSVNGPHPSNTVDDGPPPLLSIDSGPPPLISAVDVINFLPPRSNNPSQRPPLLPTPSMYMHLNYNPGHIGSQSSHCISRSLVQNMYDIPPPLVSVISQPTKERKESIPSRLPYEDYVKKYGNYILIVNIPKDITTEEIEKILYPHIPVCVSEAEVTNIRMRILFCLVTFNTKTEATKAAKQLDGVEIRGQCLSMIRLDELILFSDVPF